MTQRKYIVTIIDDGSRQSEESIRELECQWGADEIEPCEDCINREELRKLICQNNDRYGYSDRFHEFTEQCLQLPSVTPSYNSVKTELKFSEDCISREETLKAFAEKCGGECGCCEYNGSGYDTAENCKLIKSMPSVKPTRPHGEWIHFTDDFKDYAACSCCGYGEDGEVLLEDKTPFCPVCGADMREVQDEDSD